MLCEPRLARSDLVSASADVYYDLRRACAGGNLQNLVGQFPFLNVQRLHNPGNGSTTGGCETDCGSVRERPLAA